MKKMETQAAQPENTETGPPETEALMVQLLLGCGMFLQREMNRACRRYGLKQQQFGVLNEIVWQGPVSQKELADALLFEKSNISKIVQILSKKNLIKVTVAPGDRRQTLLFETPVGGEVCRDCMRAFKEMSVGFSASLTGEERVVAIRLLKKLQRAFKATR